VTVRTYGSPAAFKEALETRMPILLVRDERGIPERAEPDDPITLVDQLGG
jgi:hypothetical protein